jgi:hypothetical protein
MKWLSPAVAVFVLVSFTHARELRVVLPPMPLPPLPATKPIEDYLPAQGRPPGGSVGTIVFVGFVCGGVWIEPRETAALGLIDLFGSVANFETALAARRLEVAELGPRTDPAIPATERGPAVRLSPDDAARLRHWLTSDASYLWGEDYECHAFSHGVRVTFYHAGKIVKQDLHPAEGVATVATGEAAFIVKVASVPADIERLIARVVP